MQGLLRLFLGEFSTDAQRLSLLEWIRKEVDVTLVPSTQPKDCVAMRVKVEL